MKLVTLYDDKGRIKLPKEVLKWLKVKKGDKLVVMEVEGERSIKLVPVDEFKRTVKCCLLYTSPSPRDRG